MRGRTASRVCQSRDEEPWCWVPSHLPSLRQPAKGAEERDGRFLMDMSRMEREVEVVFCFASCKLQRCSSCFHLPHQ